MFIINRVLSVPAEISQCGHIQEHLIKEVEKLVHARIFYLDFKELPQRQKANLIIPEDKFRRRFLIERAYNERDK